MESKKAFYKIIDELCKEKNIEQKLLSYGWIRELKKDNQTYYTMNYQLGLNGAVAYNIVNDKFATYEVLKSNNVPTIDHKMIFNPKTRSRYYKNQFIEEAKKLLAESDNKVVIKANESCEGKDVFFCETELEIENSIKKLFEEKKDTLSACPYLDIEFEYRAIYLFGEIIYIYKKRKPYVIGNGKSSLKELIYIKFTKNNINIDLSKNIDLDYVPKDKEDVIVSWKHNLYNGAEPIVIDENEPFLEKIKEIAISAGQATQINFASIDIALTSNKAIYVMEVNANVCMNKFTESIEGGYEIAKNIYSKALDKMFQKKVLDSLQ